MRIAAVEPVLLGYRKTDPPMQRSFALVRIVTEDGLVGWGEASTNWGHSYPTVFATTVRDVCAPVLIGADARDLRARVADLHTRLDGYFGRDGITGQTIGALEIALWDLAGKSLDAPVCELLGATRRPIRLYGTGTTMFDESPSWHAHYFDQALAAGFRGVKVRLGRSVEEDVEVVAAVRAHVGPSVAIGVDSYWFHDARTALELASRLVEFGVSFFEEPVPQHRAADLRWLASRSPIPIAVGERVHSAEAFARLAHDGGAAVFQPDATICGGLLSCLDVVALASSAGISVVPHVGGPTAIGLAANLHWATAAGVDLCEWDIDPSQPLVDSLAPSLALSSLADGVASVPDGPGLGVTVPDDLADRFPYVPGETYTDVFPDHERGLSAAAP
ncbi:mandelate racemase/muconate lactonizing enzyme family protein [Cryptosporangium phraense]|uniref:Mandelate racemase/muconate lactonizing enzyme family protein n=1 Tax=Cryptosporangium phraense TaxID=2593070 RepID=A0A545AIG4_9ACTN|nr:mandelate racemase/muconate lactonizing enzyme family protein [Cryptosporangium phraense]TQS41116.1 mandelate racemase/muconate lactonizing enzyme family protein [Cryptosporangium phraense]